MDFLLSCLLLDCISRFLRLGLEFERTVEGQPTSRLLRPFSTLSLLLGLSDTWSSLLVISIVFSRFSLWFLLPLLLRLLLDRLSRFLRLGLGFERTVEGQPTGRL